MNKKERDAMMIKNSEMRTGMTILGKSVEDMLKERKFSICERCGGKVQYLDSGRYQCTVCDHMVMDDFGKVKAYLEENGPAAAPVIAAATGVSPETINQMLKDGRVEIPDDSEYYVQCEKCGCNIRYGRFCPGCVAELARGMNAMFRMDAGAKPKKEFNQDKGKLHFIDKRRI